jgi:hypothetical protein
MDHWESKPEDIALNVNIVLEVGAKDNVDG